MNYHDFTLVIGPIAVAENNVESHGGWCGVGAGGQPAGGGGAPGPGGVAGDQDTPPRHAIRIGFLLLK